MNNSMILENGSLKIHLPKDEVTWFAFLQLSRLVNSTQGGWDSKTNWINRGLHILASDHYIEFIKKWTKNSLKLSNKNSPKIRTSDFKIEDRNKALKEGKRGSEGMPKAGTENQLNWNLCTYLFEKNKEQRYTFTYELPLAEEQEGQLKSDIVAFIPDSNLVEIIELKRGNSSNSPLMALVESICYTLQLLRCWEHISKDESIKWGQPEKPKTINIILAAPKEYWEKCKDEESTPENFNQLNKIVSAVETAIRKWMDNSDFKLNLIIADCIDFGKGGLRAHKDSMGADVHSPVLLSR
ncbi:hypothetical protein M2103_001627 [Ereboglobus sp. PH5-5]|uniref:hypothetical protein n=1 Tax=Ereboglobus sp. PH5-5 TaxID=2940529 RepID=UPI002405EA69|nr:hypothetical protein [Ereboglobus sp. PH5-5]MDF9833403.1 hypothetical protein [Ereboglobus sp. PH5-5]